MVIDTSCLLAIFLAWPERAALLQAIVKGDKRLVSAHNVLEAGVLLEARLGDAAGRELDLFLQRAQVEVVPVDANQVEVARGMWRKYGTGHHAAELNLGDCVAYALASISGEPLLTRRSVRQAKPR